jgi:TRAP-type C4-dicarboxylate transport system substrate-binding protein
VNWSRDEFSRRANANMSAWVDRTLAELATYEGVSVYELPKAEKARWFKAVFPVWDAYVEKNGQPAQEIVDNLRKYIWEPKGMVD